MFKWQRIQFGVNYEMLTLMERARVPEDNPEMGYFTNVFNLKPRHNFHYLVMQLYAEVVDKNKSIIMYNNFNSKQAAIFAITEQANANYEKGLQEEWRKEMPDIYFAAYQLWEITTLDLGEAKKKDDLKTQTAYQVADSIQGSLYPFYDLREELDQLGLTFVDLQNWRTHLDG